MSAKPNIPPPLHELEAEVMEGVWDWDQDEVTVRFLDWSTTASLAHLAAIAYGLGMLSGWTVVGMLRRSIRRVTEGPVLVERRN